MGHRNLVSKARDRRKAEVRKAERRAVLALVAFGSGKPAHVTLDTWCKRPVFIGDKAKS